MRVRRIKPKGLPWLAFLVIAVNVALILFGFSAQLGALAQPREPAGEPNLAQLIEAATRAAPAETAMVRPAPPPPSTGG